MGLCKCPKRKVTNLFCFEHRVNVCEHCLVANHPKCIVKSYLQWLQDSDYDVRCSLCQKGLAEGDIVRLLCYDVFHLACLDEYALQLPPHTAPAGYTCPSCNNSIFPPSNMVSPVAGALRESLSKHNWARAGLGLPLIDEPLRPAARQQELMEDLYKPEPSSFTEVLPSPGLTDVDSAVYRPASTSAAQPRTMASSSINIDSSTTPLLSQETLPGGQLPKAHKRQGGSRDDEIVDIIHDHDVDKYKRRSAFHWMARWFKSRAGKKTADASTPMRRYAILLILGVIAFFTIVVVMTQAGRASANADPFLDPMANPNIRVGRKILQAVPLVARL